MGPLRFAAPLPFNESVGIFDSSAHGPNCPQMLNLADGAFNLPTAVGTALDAALTFIRGIPAFQAIGADKTSERCLNLMVQRPAGTLADAKLPVMIWVRAVLPGSHLEPS